jgi:hypothetical protein
VGKIAVSTFAEQFQAEWSWLDELLKKYTPPEPESDQPADPESDAPVFDTEEGLSDILKSAGFFRIRIRSETKDFVYADEEEWWSSMWSHVMRHSMERIQAIRGIDALADFQFEAFEELRKMKQADGIHQEITVLFAVARKL